MEHPTFDREFALRQKGYQFIAGVDEAGRGAWAGPVVAAAVIFPLSRPDLLKQLSRVHDSKRLSPKCRDELFDLIYELALAVGVGQRSASFIDAHRIVSATRCAMEDALAQLHPAPHYILVDAVKGLAVPIPQQVFPKADMLSVSVAAASIVAKVTRDRLMIDLENTYPGYEFNHHKGYGTQQHQTALSKLGPAPVHRCSFTPIKRLLETTN